MAFGVSYRSVMQPMVLVFIGLYGFCSSAPVENVDATDRLAVIADRVDVIDAKLSSVSRGHDRHSLLTRIEQRLDSIESKLDGLTSSDGLVATTSNEITNGGQQKPSQKIDEEPVEQKDFLYNKTVNLISVERHPTNEGHRVSVNFTKNTENVRIRFNGGAGFSEPPDSIVEKDGVYSASFTCPYTRHGLWMVISDKVEEEGWSFIDSRHSLHMRLNISEGNAMIQYIDPLPELHIEPPRAAIYEPGQDFNITGSVTFSGEMPEDFYLFESFKGINLTDGKIYMDLSNSDLLRKLDDSYNPNKTRETVTVLTSVTPVSGYFSFGLGLPIGGPLVLRAQVDRLITLRPSNQTTLPPNYLSIMETPFPRNSKNGNELNECRPGVECKLLCFGVGEFISDIQVVKLFPGGTTEAVPSATRPNYTDGEESLESVMWTFQANNDTEDDGDGITTFQCTAYDATNNKQVTRLVDALVILEDGVDEENTNVTIDVHYMEPHIKILTFNCAVYGRPIPEVTFSSGSSYIFNMGDREPDSVISTGRNKALATKTVRLDMDYLRDYHYTIHEDDTMPSCDFWSKSQNRYIEHTFEIPDLGLENEMEA